MEEEAAADFHDWEFLHNSGTPRAGVPAHLVKLSDGELEGIEADSGGMIRADYFCLDSANKYVSTCLEEEVLVQSNNLSWIDPRLETQVESKSSVEFWPDSGSDRSDESKSADFDAEKDLNLVGSGSGSGQVSVEAIDMTCGEALFESSTGGLEICEVDVRNDENQARGEELRKSSDDGGNESAICIEAISADTQEGSEIGGELDNEANDCVNSSGFTTLEDNDRVNESKKTAEVTTSDGEENKRVTWWKLPFEFLKYCVLRIGPIWSFSTAAAVMGFVILGRKLYKMKRKSQNLKLKDTMDDKKVSLFMNRAARLNEAFSVVRRVPLVRPVLPPSGATSWPVVGMR